jgi:hypothetical protein
MNHKPIAEPVLTETEPRTLLQAILEDQYPEPTAVTVETAAITRSQPTAVVSPSIKKLPQLFYVTVNELDPNTEAGIVAHKYGTTLDAIDQSSPSVGRWIRACGWHE